MIVVVEGISAAGKTTWCRANASAFLVPETFPSDRQAQREQGLATAQYWTNWNIKRWADALEMEAVQGRAVCDTDPLKLHYSWSLWQVGAGEKSQWELQLGTTREALQQKKLGFADAYLVKIIDPAVAREQSEADTSRSRTRFDLHVRLQEPLVRWYNHLDQVLAGRVRWELPRSGPSFEHVSPKKLRYDVGAFDEFVASLDSAYA